MWPSSSATVTFKSTLGSKFMFFPVLLLLTIRSFHYLPLKHWLIVLEWSRVDPHHFNSPPSILGNSPYILHNTISVSSSLCVLGVPVDSPSLIYCPYFSGCCAFIRSLAKWKGLRIKLTVNAEAGIEKGTKVGTEEEVQEWEKSSSVKFNCETWNKKGFRFFFCFFLYQL